MSLEQVAALCISDLGNAAAIVAVVWAVREVTYLGMTVFDWLRRRDDAPERTP